MNYPVRLKITPVKCLVSAGEQNLNQNRCLGNNVRMSAPRSGSHQIKSLKKRIENREITKFQTYIDVDWSIFYL